MEQVRLFNVLKAADLTDSRGGCRAARWTSAFLLRPAQRGDINFDTGKDRRRTANRVAISKPSASAQSYLTKSEFAFFLGLALRDDLFGFDVPCSVLLDPSFRIIAAQTVGGLI